MLVVGLALLHVAACLDIQVEGDLAFEMRLANESRGRQRWFRVGWEAGNQAKELVLKMMQVRRNVTAAPEVECLYQYPEKEQVDALLSNMMNELTKVFVRANDFIRLETRREGELSRESDSSPKGNDKGKDVKKDTLEDVSKETKKVIKNVGWKEVKKDGKKEGKKELKKYGNKEDKASAVARGGDRRFKVVSKKQKAFFELIYSNMTDEYRKFTNWTAARVERAGRDACAQQQELKQLWRALLRHALATLRDAAQRTVAARLREGAGRTREGAGRAPHHLRVRLQRYLARELDKVRAAQLAMLCDTYQLCYDDLL